MVITYEGRLAAVLKEGELRLGEHIAALEEDHPVCRFVCALAYGEQVRVDLGQPEWCPGELESVTRRGLMPEEDFRWLAVAFGDGALAEYFIVALEEVGARREELGL